MKVLWNCQPAPARDADKQRWQYTLTCCAHMNNKEPEQILKWTFLQLAYCPKVDENVSKNDQETLFYFLEDLARLHFSKFITLAMTLVTLTNWC